MNVHRETTENNVDSPVGMVKESRTDDNKSRDPLPTLQSKSKNSLSAFVQKQSGLKESRIPLKRTESNVSDESNKRVKSVEKTIRRGEIEQEWTPDSPLDFSAFGNKFYEQENIAVDQKDETNAFPSLAPRNFTTLKEAKVVALPPFEEEQEIKADFTNPSIVEYGPEKEHELPFAPDLADMIQYHPFSAFAALSAYEAKDDEEEEDGEEVMIAYVFEDDQDYLYLENLFEFIEQEEAFDVHSRFIQEEEENHPISVPFDNHLFDLKSIEC